MPKQIPIKAHIHTTKSSSQYVYLATKKSTFKDLKQFLKMHDIQVFTTNDFYIVNDNFKILKIYDFYKDVFYGFSGDFIEKYQFEFQYGIESLKKKKKADIESDNVKRFKNENLGVENELAESINNLRSYFCKLGHDLAEPNECKRELVDRVEESSNNNREETFGQSKTISMDKSDFNVDKTVSRNECCKTQKENIDKPKKRKAKSRKANKTENIKSASDKEVTEMKNNDQNVQLEITKAKTEDNTKPKTTELENNLIFSEKDKQTNIKEIKIEENRELKIRKAENKHIKYTKDQKISIKEVKVDDSKKMETEVVEKKSSYIEKDQQNDIKDVKIIDDKNLETEKVENKPAHIEKEKQINIKDVKVGDDNELEIKMIENEPINIEKDQQNDIKEVTIVNLKPETDELVPRSKTVKHDDNLNDKNPHSEAVKMLLIDDKMSKKKRKKATKEKSNDKLQSVEFLKSNKIKTSIDDNKYSENSVEIQKIDNKKEKTDENFNVKNPTTETKENIKISSDTKSKKDINFALKPKKENEKSSNNKDVSLIDKIKTSKPESETKRPSTKTNLEYASIKHDKLKDTQSKSNENDLNLELPKVHTSKKAVVKNDVKFIKPLKTKKKNEEYKF